MATFTERTRGILSGAPEDQAKTPELSDEAVVNRILGGDTALFELLIRRHNQGLYRLARSIVKDDHEARDVLQEAYIRAFTRLDSFRGPEGFRTWLYVITRNQALLSIRGNREQTSEPGSIERIINNTSGDVMRNPEVTLEQERLGKVLESAIERLPEGFRAVFVLRVIQGMSIRDTSEVLHLKEETVKTRLFRARRLLRKEFTSYVPGTRDYVYEFAGRRCDELAAAVLARISALITAGTSGDT